MTLELGPMFVLASAATAISVGVLMRSLVPPPRRLRSRLGPYLSNQVPQVSHWRGGAVGSVFGPIVHDVANRVGSLVDRSGRDASGLKLRQSGWFKGISEEEMLARYRMVQLRSMVSGVLIGLALGMVVSGSPIVLAVLVVMGLVAGTSRNRGRLDRAIEDRRDRMRIEIYTVNQLMAMRVRAGGGVIHAVRSIVQRGTGEVVSELEEALRLHRSGWSAGDAFRRVAEITPEPFCSRTYRLLAAAEERGADLAGALLSLSEDVRETRRESVKRTATKRRAAMLVPTIAILAPVLILFVVAPLPYLITSWR
jgi:tight adherence protein C